MSLILKFWQHAIDNGRVPKPVWATVSLGGQQPCGFILGWSVSKRAALKDVEKRGAADWRLVKISP